tara:strand:- start:73 stop:372 length:300 start_codon:yes stop_codon:yes gene_type:complete
MNDHTRDCRIRQLKDESVQLEWWQQTSNALEELMSSMLSEKGLYEAHPWRDAEWLGYPSHSDDMNSAVEHHYKRSQKLLQNAVVEHYIAQVLHFQAKAR